MSNVSFRTVLLVIIVFIVIKILFYSRPIQKIVKFRWVNISFWGTGGVSDFFGFITLKVTCTGLYIVVFQLHVKFRMKSKRYALHV